MLSAIMLLSIILIGYILPLWLVYQINPDWIIWIMGIYLISFLLHSIRLYRRPKHTKTTIDSLIIGFPFMIGCIAVVVMGMFVISLPTSLQNYYTRWLKRVYRWRASRPRVEISTKKQFDNLPSGYRFCLVAVIAKNTDRRKDDIIYQESYVYLGKDYGWETARTATPFPNFLNLMLDEELTIETRHVRKPTHFSISRVGGLQVPDRPQVTESVSLGTHHEWGIRVGDEIEILGQVNLDYRRNHHSRFRRQRQQQNITIESVKLTQARDWLLRPPQTEDLKWAKDKRAERTRRQYLFQPEQLVTSIMEFEGLPAGQRFMIRGVVDDINTRAWHDYVYCQSKFQYRDSWQSNAHTKQIKLETLRIRFGEDVYSFNLLLPVYLNVNKSFYRATPSIQQKFEFTEAVRLDEAEGILEPESRAYRVVKVGDEVTIHAQNLLPIDCESSELGLPCVGVEKIEVHSDHAWQIHAHEDTPPVPIRKNRFGNKQTSRFLRPPPLSPQTKRSDWRKLLEPNDKPQKDEDTK